MSGDYAALDALLARAKAAFDALSPDAQAHQRHLQRISFAAGNVALSWREPPPDTLPGETLLDTATRLTTAAAGPCPCGPCRNGALGIRGSVSYTSRKLGPPDVKVPGGFAIAGDCDCDE